MNNVTGCNATLESNTRKVTDKIVQPQKKNPSTSRSTAAASADNDGRVERQQSDNRLQFGNDNTYRNRIDYRQIQTW